MGDMGPRLALVLVLAACSPHPGRLIVVVRTDFDVPEELNELVTRVARIEAESGQEVPFTLRDADVPDPMDGTRTMPLTFAIHPREPNTEVEITLTGFRRPAAAAVVERRAIVGFVPGSTRVLDLFLSESCSLELIRCDDPDETCIDGRCVPVPEVDPRDLPEIRRPGDLEAGFDFDSGPRPDAGSDAGMDAGIDAGRSDAGSDAGDAGSCPLDAPTPLLPHNGAAFASEPTLRWIGACGAYEVQIDDSCTTPGFDACSFASPETEVAGLATGSYTPSALAVSTAAPVGRRYYWRVRACAGACGPWSAVRYFDVGRSPADLDGDGYADALVGARDQDTLAGALFLHAGGPAGLDAGTRIDVGAVAGDHFAYSIAYAGDLNADGFGDLIVSAPTRTSPERDEGAVYVFLGSAAGISTPTVLDNPDDDVNGQFGWFVASAGDLDADGFADVAIGAATQDSAARDGGRVFVYLGAPGGLAPSPIVIDAPIAEPSAQFGYNLRAGGDVNGDGFGDLLVSALAYDAGARDSGAAFLYLGEAGGVSTTAAAMLASPQADARFGASVALLDLNGDGYSDAVAGAPYHDDPASAEGAAFVFYGSPAGLPTAPDLYLPNPRDDGGAWMGDCVAAAGDLNGDGFADLAVGALFANNPENDEGNVFVYFGGPAGVANMPDVTLDNPVDQATASFGVAIAALGDLDGDGFDDLIVGAYQQQVLTNGEGAAYAFFGGSGWAPAGPDVSLENPTHHAGGRYGWSVAGLSR